MRCFALFLTVSCGFLLAASDENKTTDIAHLQKLLKVAVIGQTVNPLFVEKFSQEAYCFHGGTQPDTLIGVQMGNKWIYGVFRCLMGDSAAVKITTSGGNVFSLGELRNLLPNVIVAAPFSKK